MKLLLIAFIFLLVVGTVTAIAFGLNGADFTKTVTSINAKKFCDRTTSNIAIGVCNAFNLKGNYNVSADGLSIKQNSDGVIQVKAG